MYYEIIYNDKRCRSSLCKCCHVADDDVAPGFRIRKKHGGGVMTYLGLHDDG